MGALLRGPLGARGVNGSRTNFIWNSARGVPNAKKNIVYIMHRISVGCWEAYGETT
jgi:hypothetical protein